MVLVGTVSNIADVNILCFLEANFNESAIHSESWVPPVPIYSFTISPWLCRSLTLLPCFANRFSIHTPMGLLSNWKSLGLAHHSTLRIWAVTSFTEPHMLLVFRSGVWSRFFELTSEPGCLQRMVGMTHVVLGFNWCLCSDCFCLYFLDLLVVDDTCCDKPGVALQRALQRALRGWISVLNYRVLARGLDDLWLYRSSQLCASND